MLERDGPGAWGNAAGAEGIVLSRDLGLLPYTADSIPAPVVLNSRWRVTYNPAQWVLEHREGAQRGSRGSGYRQVKFCTRRDNLLRRIVELCGDVDPVTMAQVKALPAVHPRIERLRRECRR